MVKLFGVIALAAVAYFAYVKLQDSGMLGQGAGALKQLDEKKSEDFNKAQAQPEQ